MKKTLDKFIELYILKDTNRIDEMMELFSNKEDIQMIGIGATKPGAYEWFTGKEEIKEIILSDWNNWGKVVFDKETLRITEHNDTAWFSICSKLEQTELNEETWNFFKNTMKEMLDKDDKNAHDKMFEATHYGLRRVREKNLGVGHMYDMVITGVLIRENNEFKFHTLHWSMPVD